MKAFVMTLRFRDRIIAGNCLAQALSDYADRHDVWVLGLPRGGVPVAYEVAQALRLPLDICLVRKLGIPGYQEMAMGAIASGGVCVFNYELINMLAIPETEIERTAELELIELRRREQAYLGDRARLNVQHQVVLLIDDGIATGATMRAAIQVARAQRAKQIVVAAPVIPKRVYQTLQAEVDRVVCLSAPDSFDSVGSCYEDFGQVTDEQVHGLLKKAKEERTNPG